MKFNSLNDVYQFLDTWENYGEEHIHERLMNFEIVFPPLALQNQFAAIVEKVESIKAKYSKSLDELENLYGSLSQRAFRGEL